MSTSPNFVARRPEGAQRAPTTTDDFVSRQIQGAERQSQTVNLEHILAGIRFTETGSYRGDYTRRGPVVKGNQVYGAYGVMRDNWSELTELAGIRGAPISSPEAQDQVTGYVINEYYKRYGDWDLAAMAWYAGPQQVAKVIRRGYTGPDSIQNPKIREYVNKVKESATGAARNPEQAYLRRIPVSSIRYDSSRGSWVMPVAGQSEWSQGSWMPNTKTHRGRTHAAIDVYAAKGTPIVAPVAGKVISTKTGDIGGHTVRILGDDGITYYFAHMAEASVVTVGARVMPGYHVGYVGNSGSAKNTSPHLHMSMKKNGQTINPVSYLEKGATATVSNSQPPSAEDAMIRNTARSSSSGMTAWLQDLSTSVAGGEPEPLEPLNPSSDGLREKMRQAAAQSDDTGRMV